MSRRKTSPNSNWVKLVGIHIGLCLVLLAPTVETEAQVVTDEKVNGVDFAHDIFPLLKSKCAKCHTNGTFKGGLSLESRKKLLDSGAVVVGNRGESEIFDRISSDDPDLRMPPEGDPLSKEQIDTFGKWIDGKLDWPADLSLKASKSFSRSLSLSKVELPPTTDGEDANHPIDRILSSYFAANSIQHPSRLSDAQFVRRAKLDLLGQLPTLEEFGLSQAIDRVELVDELLSRDRDYADHWMSFWNDLLRNDYVGTGYIDGGRKQITLWLHRSLMENKPYDQFVRELINPKAEAAGFIKGIKWRGRVNASQIEPLQFSQNISQVFLGINMKCASCHDSFIDDWKLNDAYGLAAITSDSPLELHRCDVPTGKIATSKFVFPELGEIDQSAPREERLSQLAQLMTSKKNGRFARTIVNRIWERMVGRGLVHPVDVMANEAWSEQLLDYLAMDFVENGYDIKRTLKLIVTSKIYNSVAALADSKESLGDFVFKGVGMKRFTAEQLVDAIWGLTGTTPANVDAAISLPGKPLSGKWIWNDANAMQSPGGEVVNFTYEFELDEMPKFAGAVVSCDNNFRLTLNSKLVGRGDDWSKPKFFSFMKHIRKGKNSLSVRAVNGGEVPNPAALFFEGKIGFGDEQTPLLIRSDKSWRCAVVKSNGKAKKPKELVFKAAVELDQASKIYAGAKSKIEALIARLDAGEMVQARASLIKSNDLMRSLGRPNREQVVTTRPADLSTLQALDLSNGATLSGWLKRGAKLWLKKKQEKAWSDQDLVVNLFQSALSRNPTADEIELLVPRSGGSANDDSGQGHAEAVEDLLWMIVMLPEFQFVR